MLDSKGFRSVIHDLESNNEEFITGLNRFIMLGISIIKNTEDIREEIIDYDDIYQILITDLNFNFWIRVSKGTIMYKKGINRAASFRVKYKKDIFIKILKREMSGTDAFMKGNIKVDGNLTQGLRFIKLFRLLLKFINNGVKI
ncbi:MAG: SCP2 sterol-binding domain-containing protein [Candidatus Lokiarchaeota archaeon]|nr:SCP2 sterol-binding domain-containing protein [Candidatus Lokiarchaeota archaeon]